MSGFTLNIRTTNAAFTIESNDEHNGEPAPHAEVARLLRETADRIDEYRDNGLIIDINGASVGTYAFTDDEGNPS